jgi:hypothetical protein
MRRERTRPRRVALTAAFGGLAVFLWQLATASSAPGPRESPAGGEEVLHAPPRPRVRALLHGAPVLDASVSVSSHLVEAARRGQFRASASVPAPVPDEVRSYSAPPPVTVLPLSSEEHASDGLPASAMRCTRTANGLDCGSCRTDGDCSPGQGCVANRETRRFECQASECEEDTHCFPGSMCRPVTTGATGNTAIRRCVPEGVRREGEPCDTLPISPAGSCREGLRCVNQVCSAPCELGAPSGCPAGLVCTDSLNGPGCFPDCQRLGCPEGQRCSRVRDNQYRCLVDSQGDCRDTPCPEGERCNLRMSRGRAVHWCARVCNPLVSDSCSEGNVCGVGNPTVSTCFRKCDPMVLDSCGPGWTCSTVSEDMSVFGCTPELRR